MIDRYAYSNGLNNVHPGEKLFLALSCMVVCLYGRSFLATFLTFLTMSVLIVLKGRIPLTFYAKTLALPLTFALVGSITTMVDIVKGGGGFICFVTLGATKIGITQAGFREGLLLFAKTFSCISCLYMFSLTTPMADTLNLMARLGIPPILVELAGIIYRFIFVYIDTASAITMAQSSRLGYGSLKSAYRSLGFLVSNLAIRSLKHARDLNMALEARGYNGKLDVLQRRYRLSAVNLSFIAAVIASVVFVSAFESKLML